MKYAPKRRTNQRTPERYVPGRTSLSSADGTWVDRRPAPPQTDRPGPRHMIGELAEDVPDRVEFRWRSGEV